MKTPDKPLAAKTDAAATITQKEPDMAIAPPVHSEDILNALLPSYGPEVEKIKSLHAEIENARDNPLSNVDAIHGIYAAMTAAFDYGTKILNTPNYIPAWLVKNAEFLVIKYNRHRLTAKSPYRYNWIHAEKIKQTKTKDSLDSHEYKLTIPPSTMSGTNEYLSRNIIITENWGHLSASFQHLIEKNMIDTVSVTGLTESRIETGILILPFSGENLSRHKKIRIMSEELQSVFTDFLIETLQESFKATHKLKSLKQEYNNIKSNISRKMSMTDDFREISEIVLPNSSREFIEEMKSACVTASRSRIDFTKSENPNIRDRYSNLNEIVRKISEMPDEHDAAILWLGLSNGTWLLH